MTAGPTPLEFGERRESCAGGEEMIRHGVLP